MRKLVLFLVLLMFSLVAFSEEWRYLLDRESDGKPIEMDFHSVKAEKNYIFLDIRYAPPSGWKSLLLNVAYHQEGIVVSCAKKSFAVATEIEVLKDGSKKIKSSTPLPSLKYISPNDGSEPKRIIETLCEKLSPQMGVTEQATAPVQSKSNSATPTLRAKSEILNKSPTEYHWRYLAKGVEAQQNLFISTPLIARVDENNIIVVAKSEYPESKRLPSGNYFKYDVTQQIINCKESTAFFPRIDYYSEEHLLVETYYRQIAELEAQKIPVNSLIESVLNTACPIGLAQAMNEKSTGNSDGESTPTSSTGTAWLISPSNLVTAYHVIDSATSILVVVGENDFMEAVVVASDPTNDIAILKLKKPLKSPPLYLATKQPKLGAKVAALGYPLPDVLGLKIQATTGEISGLRGLRDDQRFYQISAPVQPGNSGGPLLNQDGEVVGIISSKLNAMEIMKVSGDVPQNVNFSMKYPYVKALLESAGIIVKSTVKKTNGIENSIQNAINSVYLIAVSRDSQK